jgi:hypothetical protein
MAEIVNSLFGVSPEQLMRQRQATDASNAFKFAQLDPLEQAKFSIYQGSAGLGRGVQGLLGGDPELEKVSAIKQLSSQFDLTSPTGMREFAKSLQQIAPQEAMMAAKRADEMDLGVQQRATQRSQEIRNLREPTRTAMSQLIAAGKYTPASIALYEKSQDPADLVLVEKKVKGDGDGGGVGIPGPVGKAGAYRDISGTILGPAEMKPIRQEFEGAQKLLNTLNQISAQDVKDAESYIDWTTKAETKGLASDKTLKAQTKVAASQLLEQINQLPPGSASDADMRAAMKSFPGYSNPEALAEWVNRTKGLLQFSINRGTDQFGFTARVKPTEPIDLKKKKQTTKPTDQNQAALDWLKANPNDSRAPAVRQKLGIQ